MDADRPEDEPLDALTGEQVTYGEKRSSVLVPEGQIESVGDFARSLGPRRVKIALFVGGGIVLLLALLTAIS